MTRAIPNEEVFPFAAGWARGRELRDCDGDGAADGHRDARAEPHREDGRLPGEPGMNCVEIGLPGKRILSKRKGLREVLFSWK